MNNYQKKWREENPEKRKAEKKKYYKKNREHPKNQRMSGTFWTEEDLFLIISTKKESDAIIARIIGRSVQAIQVKRSKLKCGHR